MRDAYTNWRTASDGDLTETETTAAIKIGQAPIGGHPVVVHVPEQVADADTLDITWTESATLGGSYREFQKSRPQVTGAASAAGSARGGSLALADRLQNNLPFVKCVLTVAGSAPNFGEVTVGMDLGQYRNVLKEGAYAAP